MEDGGATPTRSLCAGSRNVNFRHGVHSGVGFGGTGMFVQDGRSDGVSLGSRDGLSGARFQREGRSVDNDSHWGEDAGLPSRMPGLHLPRQVPDTPFKLPFGFPSLAQTCLKERQATFRKLSSADVSSGRQGEPPEKRNPKSREDLRSCVVQWTLPTRRSCSTAGFKAMNFVLSKMTTFPCKNGDWAVTSSPALQEGGSSPSTPSSPQAHPRQHFTELRESADCFWSCGEGALLMLSDPQGLPEPCMGSRCPTNAVQAGWGRL